MERVLSGEFGHVFVTSNTRRFQRLARYIFFLPTHKVNAERKLVRCSFFRTNIVYTDFGIWNTPTVSRFRVGFVLNLTVTPGWTCKTKPTQLNKKLTLSKNRKHSLRNQGFEKYTSPHRRYNLQQRGERP